MTRPLSWYPLAASDPVPGDPSAVRTAGQGYTRVAAAIERAARDLTSIADVGDTVSYAVDQVREKATEVSSSIQEARRRYEEVGAALTTYASSLDTAQSESAAALAEAQAAQSAIDSAATSVAAASRSVDDAEDDEERLLHQGRLDRARDARDDAESRLAAARRRLEEAVALRDSAARAAVTSINDVTSSDGLKDSWWQNLHLDAIAKVVSDIAGVVAAVAGVLALVLCWVPVLGQALAAVALIASAVKLVADIALLSMGEGSWADVAWGVVAVASFGVGRVLSIAAQSATRSGVAVARLTAGKIGAMSRTERAARGFPTTSAATVIRDLTGPTGARLSRGAAQAAARRANLDRYLGGGLRSMSPSAIFSDVGAIRPFLHDGAAWSRAMGQARSTFGAAGSNPAALFAASQADDALVRAIGATDEISVILRNQPTVAHALSDALAWQAGSAGLVGIGAYDATVGLQGTVESVTTGAPLDMPVVENVQSIVDWFGPSPAEQLDLVR